MGIQTKMKSCLKKWMSDMDLWDAMVFLYKYSGSPSTLSRERRKLVGIDERYAVNQNGVQYKQFRGSKS